MVAIEGTVEFAHQLDGAGIFGAHHDAVRFHEIADRGAFLEEFRIGHDVEIDIDAPFLQNFADAGGHLVARADRDGGLVHHDLEVGHVFGDRFGDRQNVLQVGRTVFIRRCAHGDELDLAETDPGLGVGGEQESACLAVALHHIAEPGFVDGHAAIVQDVDFCGIHIYAHHLVADLCEAGAGDESHVTAAENRDFHNLMVVLAVWVVDKIWALAGGLGRKSTVCPESGRCYHNSRGLPAAPGLEIFQPYS